MKTRVIDIFLGYLSFLLFFICLFLTSCPQNIESMLSNTNQCRIKSTVSSQGPSFIFSIKIDINDNIVLEAVDESNRGKYQDLPAPVNVDINSSDCQLTDNNLSFPDLNFDGLLDVKILVSTSQEKGNNYSLWLYNKDNGTFEELEGHGDSCWWNISIYPESKEISTRISPDDSSQIERYYVFDGLTPTIEHKEGYICLDSQDDSQKVCFEEIQYYQLDKTVNVKVYQAHIDPQSSKLIEDALLCSQNYPDSCKDVVKNEISSINESRIRERESQLEKGKKLEDERSEISDTANKFCNEPSMGFDRGTFSCGIGDIDGNGIVDYWLKMSSIYYEIRQNQINEISEELAGNNISIDQRLIDDFNAIAYFATEYAINTKFKSDSIYFVIVFPNSNVLKLFMKTSESMKCYHNTISTRKNSNDIQEYSRLRDDFNICIDEKAKYEVRK